MDNYTKGLASSTEIKPSEQDLYKFTNSLATLSINELPDEETRLIELIQDLKQRFHH